MRHSITARPSDTVTSSLCKLSDFVYKRLEKPIGGFGRTFPTAAPRFRFGCGEPALTPNPDVAHRPKPSMVQMCQATVAAGVAKLAEGGLRRPDIKKKLDLIFYFWELLHVTGGYT
jgi:hypothetical protein